MTASGDASQSLLAYSLLTAAVCFALGWWLRSMRGRPGETAVPEPVCEPAQTRVAQLEARLAAAGEEIAAAARQRDEIHAQFAMNENALASAEAARDGALRELDSLRTRIASADEIHKRANQRESEHQRTLDALTAAELNLKAARVAEAQANARAMDAEAVLARSDAAAVHDREQVPALERQLGEVRRMEAAASAELAGLRVRLAETRAQLTAIAGDEALAGTRDAAAKAHAEMHAVAGQNNQLRRELAAAAARIAQLEAASLTLHAQKSWPPPELAEARSAAEKARAAAKSAEGTAGKLRRDLADARTRINGLESTLAATRQASAALATNASDLTDARKAADNVRAELKNAREEIRRLKSDLNRSRPRQQPNTASPVTPSAAEAAPAEAPGVALRVPPV